MCVLTHVLVSLATPPPAQMQLHGLALLPGWPRRALRRGCSRLARGRRVQVGGGAAGGAAGGAGGDVGGGAAGGEGGRGTAAEVAVELGAVEISATSAVEITRSRREAKGKLPMLGGGGGGGGGGGSGGGEGGGSCSGEPPDSPEAVQPPSDAAGVSGTRSRLAGLHAMAQQWGGRVSRCFPQLSAALAALLVAIVIALVAACF